MTTWRKKLSLGGPVKQTCQRLRQVRLMSFAHVRGSAPMMSAAHLPLTTESMSIAVWEWKKNALAWQCMWLVKWREPAAGWIGLDTGMHCMLWMHPVQSWDGSAAACQRCFHSSSNSARSLSWLSSINAWYISTTGVAEHGIHTWLVSIAALQIGVPWPWPWSTSCNDLSMSASVIKACSVFCFCTHTADDQRFNFKL